MLKGGHHTWLGFIFKLQTDANVLAQTVEWVLLRYLVCLLQTAPSGANIGVWCLVRMKQVHIINFEQNSAIKKLD